MFCQVTINLLNFEIIHKILLFHTIEAAHCFQNKGHPNPVAPEFVKAFMGKYDLNITDELGSKSSLIWKIFIHPDWNWNEEKFDADISMIVIYHRVKFNQQIQPVCLPKPSYHEVRGNGVVVGWGRSENTGYSHGYESRPNQLLIPAVNSSHCYTTFSILGSFSSNRAFCGGYENQGRAPCLGDSGGGFYMKDEYWNIRGIVSAAIVDFDRGCDINKFSIYTNVGRFTEWIDETMKTTKVIIWTNVVFKCIKNDDM
jgi:Trypsin